MYPALRCAARPPRRRRRPSGVHDVGVGPTRGDRHLEPAHLGVRHAEPGGAGATARQQPQVPDALRAGVPRPGGVRRGVRGGEGGGGVLRHFQGALRCGGGGVASVDWDLLCAVSAWCVRWWCRWWFTSITVVFCGAGGACLVWVRNDTKGWWVGAVKRQLALFMFFFSSCFGGSDGVLWRVRGWTGKPRSATSGVCDLVRGGGGCELSLLVLTFVYSVDVGSGVQYTICCCCSC